MQLQLRLSIDIDYTLDPSLDSNHAEADLRNNLEQAAEHLAAHGLLSGETANEVDSWSCQVIKFVRK